MIDPIAFEIPIVDWPVRWYGLVYAGGMLISAWWLPSLLAKRGQEISKEKAWDLVFWMFVGAVIGGRLGHFLFYEPQVVWQDPLMILQIWKGGMAFHGGLLGAILVASQLCKKWGISMLKLGDVIVVPISLILAGGRLANWVNGEIIGGVTDLSWGIQNRGFDDLRHPTQFLEAGKNLLLFFVTGILTWMKKLPDGGILGVWILGYGILRFVIEFWKEPEWMFADLNGGQWLCLGMIFGGQILLRWVFLKKKIST